MMTELARTQKPRVLPDLIQNAQRGDPVAIHALLGACQADARRYAYKHCHASDIDDAVQEALLLISRKITAPDEGRGKDIPELCHQWLAAYLKLNLVSIIYSLLRERDEVLDKLIDAFPGKNVLEDRTHEVFGYQLVEFNSQIDDWKKVS